MARAIILMMDSFGIGGAPDGAKYGNDGADTLGHIAAAGKGLNIPNLHALGLSEAAKGASGKYPAIGTQKAPRLQMPSKYGHAKEISMDKDTVSGHWEMAGLPNLKGWGHFKPDYPSFPAEVIENIVRESGIPGILGNKAASGTVIIQELGEEHIRTGKPIFYTSADSNMQIAAHENHFGLVQKMTIEEQKKAVRSGYDMDIIPTDLATYGEEAKNLLQDLQSRNERMFLVTVLVENIAAKRQKLFNDIFAASGVAQKYNCALKRLDYQQEQGLMSSLALGTNQIEIERGLTTSSTAIFVPFTTCELFQEGEALYYGLNALSNNLIMANRKTLKNPNGLFLGTPGSGKSFSAKREIVNVLLLTEDDIIIADPENEYGPLVQQFGSQGQVIDISPTSTNYINPMDINLDYSDDENPITLKSDFILSLCDLIIGGKEGLSPIERTIIDRCTRLVYREYLQNPCPENMPILGDLYELLLKQSEPEAQNIATALEIYVNGSLNVFNHRSNIQMDKHRVLCFQLKSLGKALKEIGLLIMQDAVWNRVTANRSKHKTTWFYIDEFHRTRRSAC